MTRRVLFYVQHLLGIGHLVRAGRIATALAHNFEVLFVVGGELPPGLEPGNVNIFQLPPVKAGEGGFSALVHPDGSPFDTADKAERRDLLLGCFDRFLPDVVLIEAFPFGRRPMRFELVPLLERASSAAHRPLIACSVRDILQDTRRERQEETVALVHSFFDVVLVHGDPDVFTLPDSFPAATAFKDRIRYTGMVGPDPSHEASLPADESFDVVVSVGGGAVGAHLLQTAIAARPMTSLRQARWLALTGPNLRPDETWPDDDGLVVRTFAADLPARLARARVSVSQAGYNTVADLVAARCRPVLVPIARAGETEQTRRAALFHDRGWAIMLAEADLAPKSLASAIEQALHLPDHGADITLGGAERSRVILEQQLGLL